MTPKYEQLVQELRAALPQWYADGQRKLPGEQALAAQLSVSRQTLRQALAVLEQEGLIEKRRGSGSFLCPAAARQDRRIAVIATSLSDYIFPSLLKDVLSFAAQATMVRAMTRTSSKAMSFFISVSSKKVFYQQRALSMTCQMPRTSSAAPMMPKSCFSSANRNSTGCGM